MPIKNSIARMQDELTRWRRDLHAHPELRFEETRTAALVAERLRGFGCDSVETGVAGTGVVAVIRGRSDGPVLGFRADMDALPIPEMSGVAHASTVPGKMHACGHDGHTIMLLGAARYLAETRNFAGSVVLLFQPAEEGGGGALAMIADGVMERFGIDEVYGLHNMPGLAAGAFGLRPGPLLAAADFFDIEVQGQGGHGARPQGCIDATLVAAHVVVALQAIVARNADPQHALVISVGGIRSDSDAHNVIADRVTLKGTVRYLEPGLRDLAEARLREVAGMTARAHGATATLRYTPLVAPTVNADAPFESAAQAAEIVSGAVDRDTAPVMAGEDFADMLAVRPGAFIFLGNGESAGLHNPAYDFNDAILPVGASWFATLAETRLG